MTIDRLAQEIAKSLARHQSRGLVDGATGITDVVVHGRVDLLSVADDVLKACLFELKPTRRSWAGWFIHRTDVRRRMGKQAWELEKLSERLGLANSEAEAAIIRLRHREASRL